MSSPAPDPGATARVERALARLEDLDSRPTAEHAPIYAAVHGELSEVLASAGADPTPLDPDPAADAAHQVPGSGRGTPDDQRND